MFYDAHQIWIMITRAPCALTRNKVALCSKLGLGCRPSSQIQGKQSRKPDSDLWRQRDLSCPPQGHSRSISLKKRIRRKKINVTRRHRPKFLSFHLKIRARDREKEKRETEKESKKGSISKGILSFRMHMHSPGAASAGLQTTLCQLTFRLTLCKERLFQPQRKPVLDWV